MDLNTANKRAIAALLARDMGYDREAARVLYDMLPPDEQLLVRTMHVTIPSLAAGVGVTSGWFD